MDISILEDIGLKKGEISVYLNLLELGETKVGNIIEDSGMASSAVHNSVNSLIKKGLVCFVKKGKIKYYKSVPPKQIISFIDSKKEKVIKILPELESKQKKIKSAEEAEIFQGIKGVITMLKLLIENSKKGDEYLFFSINVDEYNKEIQEFFSMFDMKRKTKGLVTKGLAPKNLKKFFKNRNTLKMKYTNFPIPLNTSLCNDKIAFFSWDKNPVGYLIKSQQISSTYKGFFQSIWNKY